MSPEEEAAMEQEIEEVLLKYGVSGALFFYRVEASLKSVAVSRSPGERVIFGTLQDKIVEACPQWQNEINKAAIAADHAEQN